MSIRTIRFNKDEERMLKKILLHYKTDFSSCVKGMIEEKLETLADLNSIKGIRESQSGDYLTSKEIDSPYKEK